MNGGPLYEKRLLYFSNQRGLQDFEQKIRKTLKAHPRLPTPRTILDQAVEGPWSEFSKVWRFLFENNEPRTNDISTFFF